MREEDDLGPIYGSQWVNWNGEGINQLRQAIDKLKKDPTDRRLIVTAWNPSQMDQMALPPCHFCFQLASDGEYLNLAWSQRSVDTPVGLPFDIASYGMLLLLICQETGLKPGKLVGFLADTHIYVDQIDAVKEELSREPRKSPVVKVTNTFPGWRIEDWTYTDFELSEYDPYEPIKIPVAV
jgi:thymidylate synthase